MSLSDEKNWHPFGLSMLEVPVLDAAEPSFFEPLVEASKKSLMLCVLIFSDGVGDADVFAFLPLLVLQDASDGGPRTTMASAGLRDGYPAPKAGTTKVGTRRSCRSRAVERSRSLIKSRSERLVLTDCDLE